MAKDLTIYSWNMLFRNKRLDEAFAFIRDAEFDIFCLQEVPPAFFDRLKELPYHLASAVDNERLTPPRGMIRLVILSPHPISNMGTFRHPNYWPTLPLRTRLFVRLMRPFGWAHIQNREGLYADLDTPHGSVRVFNLHIVNGTIEKRLGEFERSMLSYNPSLPTIICGDLNTIESPRVALVNWLHGGPLSEVFGFRQERQRIEQRFVELALENVFRERSTHAFAGSQFDHILVSRHWTVVAAEIIRNRYGSDHHPLRVTVS